MGADGCNPTVRYEGATVIDLPLEGLYDQNLAAASDRHTSLAAGAGIRGFLASWKGTGDVQQDPAASGFNTRLDLLVKRLDAYNWTHPNAFALGLGLCRIR
jgi:hypothetical protein